MPHPSPLRRTPLLALALAGITACRGLPRPDVAPTDAPPGDAQVASIAMIANNVEIGYATLAPDRAADADVQAFAARMRTDHVSLNRTLTELTADLRLTARDDPAGIALRDSSAVHRARLRAMSGRAFDVAYADLMVRSHQELLGLIDRVLAPAATRGELREYLTTLRPVVTAHLAHAELLRATLAARRE